MNTLLYRDKALIRTLSSPIYQNENRADYIKFLISTESLSHFDLNELSCVLCVTLPDGVSGKIGFLHFKDTLYHDQYLEAYVPLTKALTKSSGELSLSLIFSYEDMNNLLHFLPTNEVTFTILESKSSDSFIDPDETTNPLTEISQKIKTIENSKISCLEIDGHKVHLYADRDKTILLGSHDLPEDVVWTTMEDM